MPLCDVPYSIGAAIVWSSTFIRDGHLAIREAFWRLTVGTDIHEWEPWRTDTEPRAGEIPDRQCLSDNCYNKPPGSHSIEASINVTRARKIAGV